MPPCCEGCALGGLGDVEGGGNPSRVAGRPLMLLAGSLGALALFLWLYPEARKRRRPPAMYHDPRNDGRRTMELPAFESMSEVVFQRKR